MDAGTAGEKRISQSLLDSLKQHRLQVARAALASKPHSAFDLLVFKAACGAFTHNSVYTGPDLTFSQNHFRSDKVEDAGNTVAGKAILAA